MSARFEELDWRETPIGTISLRRRLDPRLNTDVYEVKLDDDFLMSSLFTVAEVELARLGLAQLPSTDLDVVVGGLGLGYTARAALEDRRVRSLLVIEALDPVIEWHQRALVPFAAGLATDQRTRLAHGDFFAMLDGSGLDPAAADQHFHAVLLDIDHSPRHVLDPSHTPFYGNEGLRRLKEILHPGGVFALWSNDPPDEEFNATLQDVFATSAAHIVTFTHPYGGESANTVYVAQRS